MSLLDEAFRQELRARRGKPWATCQHGVRWRTCPTGGIEVRLSDHLADGEEFEVHFCEDMGARPDEVMA